MPYRYENNVAMVYQRIVNLVCINVKELITCIEIVPSLLNVNEPDYTLSVVNPAMERWYLLILDSIVAI